MNEALVLISHEKSPLCTLDYSCRQINGGKVMKIDLIYSLEKTVRDLHYSGFRMIPLRKRDD